MVVNQTPRVRFQPQTAGIGLRRELVDSLLSLETNRPAFVEIAPENWMGLGGFWRKKLEAIAADYPLTSHGLSLSLGSVEPLDFGFLRSLKEFFKEIPVQLFSEHLSYTKCENAHLYDLLPIPFREESIKHVASRIRQAQEILETRIAIENVSYYSPVAPTMTEAEFVKAVVEEADCDLLLDVNNVFVNAFNHGYDAKHFIESLPLHRVRYLHMAGHEHREDDLIIDSHGEPIIDPVYDLFSWTLQYVQVAPVLLERDFNIPDYQVLAVELDRLSEIMSRSWEFSNAA